MTAIDTGDLEPKSSADSDSIKIEQGRAQFMLVTDVGWSIDLDGVRKDFDNSDSHDSAGFGSRSDIESLNLPVPPMMVKSFDNETIELAGFRSAPRTSYLISDTGAISARLEFPLEGRSIPELKQLAHELDEDAQGRLRQYGHDLIAKLVERIRPHIEEPKLRDDTQTYRVFRIESLEGGRSAMDLLKVADVDLAHILKGEIRDLAPEQVEDALSIASSYFAGERTIIETRNAVLLGKANYRDVGTVLGFAVVELLELKVLEGMLERYLESDRLTVGGAKEETGMPFRIRRFNLDALDQIQQEASIQLGRVRNPLKLFDDTYYADLRGMISTRIGLEKWADQINAHLSTLREIGTDLSNKRHNKSAILIEIGVFLLVAYEATHLAIYGS